MPKAIPETTTAADGVAAVDRALLIATALARAEEPCTLTALSNMTGLYKSTLLRLLASLQRAGLVVQRPDKTYVLGSLAFMFGRAFERSHGLEETVQPVLRWLVTQGTESPSFHVRSGEDTRLCLLRLDSNHSTLDRVRAGDTLPLHKGAAGKVLKTFDAGMPQELAPTQLLFTSFGERDPLCGAVAAPVFGPANVLLGALSLSGPLERFSDRTVHRMGEVLLFACERASRGLGGGWPQAVN